MALAHWGTRYGESPYVFGHREMMRTIALLAWSFVGLLYHDIYLQPDIVVVNMAHVFCVFAFIFCIIVLLLGPIGWGHYFDC